MRKYNILVWQLLAVPTLLPGCSRAPFSDNGAAVEASAGLEAHVGGSGTMISHASGDGRGAGAAPTGAVISRPVPSADAVGGPFDIHALCAGKSIDDECMLPLLGSRGSAGRCKLPTGPGSPDGSRLFCFTRLDVPCDGKNVGDDCTRATPGPRQVAGQCVAVPSHGVGNDGDLLCLTEDDLTCDGKVPGTECDLPKATRFSFRGQREYKGLCRAVPSGRRGNDTILRCAPSFR